MLAVLDGRGNYPTHVWPLRQFPAAGSLARIFGTVNPLPNLEKTWNMAPTCDAPVVRQSREGERYLDALKWGLVRISRRT
jgi:putative SOS response-associated peptidase YedK